MKKVSKKMVALVAGLVAMLTLAVGAFAAVTFDSATGTGFVGKGDVQLAFGWNNKQLQNNANAVQFRYASDERETWTCSRPTPNPNDPETERQVGNRHLTQSVSGAPDADPRQTKGQQQFTGFILKGYLGAPVIESGGQALNSCPSGSGAEWTYDEGSNVVEQLGGGLEVSVDGTNWYSIPITIA